MLQQFPIAQNNLMPAATFVLPNYIRYARHRFFAYICRLRSVLHIKYREVSRFLKLCPKTHSDQIRFQTYISCRECHPFALLRQAYIRHLAQPTAKFYPAFLFLNLIATNTTEIGCGSSDRHRPIRPGKNCKQKRPRPGLWTGRGLCDFGKDSGRCGEGHYLPTLDRASFTASMRPLLEKVAPAAVSTSVDCALTMASGMVSKAGSETPAVSPWDSTSILLI